MSPGSDVAAAQGDVQEGRKFGKHPDTFSMRNLHIDCIKLLFTVYGAFPSNSKRLVQAGRV